MRPVRTGLTLLAATLALAAGCGRSAPRTLRVCTWAGHVKPELVQRFEGENGCRVVIDTVDSHESMYAKLAAGGSGCDIATPSSYMVTALARQGMLRALDPARLPNLAHVDPAYLRIARDTGMVHGVPYVVTHTGIAYLGREVRDVEPSWSVFDRADLEGRMTMLDDMRETLGAALKSLGHSLNTADDAQLDRARDVVIRWRRNLAGFEDEPYAGGAATGPRALVHGPSEDLRRARAGDPDLVFVVPREGVSVACDELVIPRDAKAAGLAHRFIDFLHDPGVAAENSRFLSCLCPNAAAYALLPAAFRDDPAVRLDPAVLARCEVIRDLGPDNARYARVWDQVKAADEEAARRAAARPAPGAPPRRR